MCAIRNELRGIYNKLYARFGRQYWWPGNTPFEVIVGAILTQNTNWQNVARAIENLKKAKVLSPGKMRALNPRMLAALIRPSGYYNIKAQRLKNFIAFLFKSYSGSLKKMFSRELALLREELLAVKGIGPETADSILLYAGNYPVFVVDAYTRRIFSRHKIITEGADYHEIRKLFMDNLKEDVRLYNEYHALIVRLGKEICKKNVPHCSICPLKDEKIKIPA